MCVELFFYRGIVRLPPLPAEYSVSDVRSDGNRGRIYLRNDRRRLETEFANGQRHIVIGRGDLGVAWIWQNADPWLETSMDWQLVSGDVDPSNAQFWKEVGRVDIDGEPCTQFRGFADHRGGAVQEECFVLPSGIRRRIITYRQDGSVGIVIDCLDVSLGPPALGLFELPVNADVQRIGGRTHRRSGPRPRT